MNFGTFLGTLGHFGDTLGTLWGHIGDTLGTLWGHFGEPLGTFLGPNLDDEMTYGRVYCHQFFIQSQFNAFCRL